MDEKISIIIPVFNASKTIDLCLKSIISQTYKNIEIIIIDDGSTDNTESIINNYAKIDDRIKLIKQKNSGVSTARNNGVMNANGSYIMFVDCDDWLENNMVEKMYMSLIENEVDVVRCNYFDDKLNGTTIGKMYNLSGKKIMKKEYNEYKVLEHFLLAEKPIKNLVMLLLIKKSSLINNVSFHKDLYMMEDVYYYLELFNNISSIFFLDVPLYHYCENGKSVTNSPEKYEKNIFGILDTNKKIRDYLYSKNIMKDKINLLNANHIRIIIMYLYYIYIYNGRKNLLKIVKELYKDENFKYISKNINNTQLSTFFRIMADKLLKNEINILCILFYFRKIKNWGKK